MKLKYIEKSDYDATISSKKFSKKYSSLRFYSGKTYRELYHDSECQLVGAIGEGLAKEAGKFTYNDGEQPYYALVYDDNHYQIVGYIVVGRNEHLALISKRRKKLKLPLIAICIIACLIVGFALWKVSNGNSNMDGNAKDYTPKNVAAIHTDPNHIALPGYDDLKMKANTDMLYVSLWNPGSNPCNFQFIITMANGEKLYESKLVGPGKAITQVKLSHKIKEGVYDIVININAYSLKDDKLKMNSGNVNTRLIAVKEKME